MSRRKAARSLSPEENLQGKPLGIKASAMMWILLNIFST